MLRVATQLTIVALLVLYFVCKGPSVEPEANAQQAKGAGKADKGKNAAGAGFTVVGRTQCAPGKQAIMAPVPLHPVDEVLVAPGDRVKKDQVLVKLDDDEPQADVRAKEAAAVGAKIAHKEAKRYWDKVQEMYKHGAFPEASYFAALAAALKAEQDERGAIASWEAAKYELEHYEVKAPIDGVISWMKVYPGTVSRPGTTVWGEILDLSEIDVKCDVSLEQVDRIKVEQPVEINQPRNNGAAMKGNVKVIGVTVDAGTSLVTVIVRVPNPDGRLRCGEPVQITFGESTQKK